MTGARTPPRLMTLVALTALGALSMNMLLPSIPSMARDFGVDYRVMQLSVTGYLAASAGLQLVVGPLSDRYGRRPVMLGGIAVFLLATIGTLLAQSAGLFLAFRLTQAAITASFVIPRAVIRDTAPPDRAASLIGYVTMGMSVVPMLAPVAGGALDEIFGWRASFIVLGVAGLLVGAWAWVDMGETASPRPGGFGAQLRAYPALLRSARFWGYCLAATFASGAFFAYLGGAPFVGGEVFHMTPAVVGYWFMAPSIGYLLGNFVSGRYSERIGLDRMILLGASVSTLALGLAFGLDLLGATSPLSFFGAVAVTGLGNGLLLPSANAGVMSVRPELAGSAAGLSGALVVAGGAALAAVAGVLLVPGSGATPLLAIMAATSTASLLALFLARRR